MGLMWSTGAAPRMTREHVFGDHGPASRAVWAWRVVGRLVQGSSCKRWLLNVLSRRQAWVSVDERGVAELLEETG